MGWNLIPAITTDGSLTVEQVLASIGYVQILRYDTTRRSLTSVQPSEPARTGEAYYVRVAANNIWQPPLPQDVTTRFTYDGDGGRVKQTTAAGTTTYLGESVEIAPDGTTTKYIFAGSQRIAALETRGTTQTLRFYHGDHLGSSNVITDATGAVVQQLDYTPYGSVHANSGSVDVTHKFTGQRQDATNGLILFPARAYDPSLGRFLQPDPFVQDPSDPQTLNRYSYVRNNPLRYVDPSGNFAFLPFLVGLLIAALIGGLINGLIAVATGQSFLKGFVTGAAIGAAAFVAGVILGPAIASATAAAKTGSVLAKVALLTLEAAQAGIAGAVGGGVSSSLEGGSFGEGATIGAILGVATFGVTKIAGGLFGPSAQTETSGVGDALKNQLAKAGLGVKGSKGNDAFKLLQQKVDLLDFSTGESQAVFYSGPGQAARAQAFAKAQGKLAIEMTKGGQQLLDDPLFQSLSTDQQYLIWQKASAPFAKGASGKINAFIKGAKTTRTFRSIEEPILDQNPNIYGRRYWY